MITHDLESDLRRELRALAVPHDDVAATRMIDLATTRPRRARRWAAPLGAAAAVLVMAGGIFAAARDETGGRTTPAATAPTQPASYSTPATGDDLAANIRRCVQEHGTEWPRSDRDCSQALIQCAVQDLSAQPCASIPPAVARSWAEAFRVRCEDSTGTAVDCFTARPARAYLVDPDGRRVDLPLPGSGASAGSSGHDR